MKNSSDSADLDRFVTGLTRLDEEAGGAFDITVITPPDAVNVYAACMAGDDRARRLVNAMNYAFRAVADAPAHRAIQCASCTREIRTCSWASFVIAHAHRDDPTSAITMIVCDDCATEPAEIERKALPAFQQIWPDLRLVAVTGQGGRA